MLTFNFDLAALDKTDRLTETSEHGGQVFFPHTLKEGSFLPKKYQYFFVDAGVKAKYSYITKVPAGAAFVILHCWFEYADKRKFGHAAERTVAVPPTPSLPASS